MARAKPLLQDKSGISAVEFALLAPVLFMMIVGLTQIGRLFFAEADLQNALAAGARQATIFPRPEDDIILDHIESQLTGINPELTVNEITHGIDEDGHLYSDLRIAYNIELDFIFFRYPSLTLTAERRVFTHEPATASSSSASTSASSSTSTSSTSTGGTTTTSGGDGSTSTGGTTSTSGGDSSTSTGGNNGNGNGNGHGNGNGQTTGGTCRRC